MDRRAFLIASIRIAGGAALAACAPAAPGLPAASAGQSAAATRRGGTLNVAIEADPVTIDPSQTGGLPGRRIDRAIFDPLIEIDANNKLGPGLVERWEIPDPRTYVFYLRQGVTFHDGTPFDADAVKFHFDRHTAPNTRSRRNGELLSVAGTEIVDRHTIKVKLKASYAAFLAALFDWSGYIVSPAAVQKYGDDFGVHPVGTGPFRFVSYAQDQQTVVQRNPDYWQKDRPILDGVVFRVIPVDSTRLTELRAGGVQIAEDMPFQDVERMRGMSELVLSEKQGFRFEYIRWNADVAPSKSLEFRMALNYALDREAIHKTVYFSTGGIGYDPFLPGMAFYDPTYKPFTRDISKAKQLLDRSGVSLPAKFTMYAGVDPVRRKELQIIQDNLNEIGVNADIQQEQGAAAQARTDRGDWTLSISWWGYRPDPAQYLSTQWHSKSTYYKNGNVKDPEVDRLLDTGEGELDPDRRKATYRQLATRMNESANNVFYHNGSNFKGVSPGVRGFVHFQDTIVRWKDISLA
jgi:peptide/nickel transport system substrate-binding protein